MKILVTGANGYIGKRLINYLLSAGHNVVALVRDQRRFDYNCYSKFTGVNPDKLQVIQGDLMDLDSCEEIPKDIAAAYYLVHSMSASKPKSDFYDLETLCAKNFIQLVVDTEIQQTIYLGGIANDQALSKHLSSRVHVEEVLKEGKYHLTVLRAAIIIGSGRASFEMIRDLLEKLPVMFSPKCVSNKCQPIAIYDVMRYLLAVLLKYEAFDQVFDIGGPDVLTYKEMLLGYAKVRGLKRWVVDIPFMSTRFSSYWLYLVTSTTFSLARALVDSLKNEVVCKQEGIKSIIPQHKCYDYETAVKRALYRVNTNNVFSSWTDSLVKGAMEDSLYLDSIERLYDRQKGVFIEENEIEFDRDMNEVVENLWSIGGKRGWYYMDWAWEIRGFLDKLVGGVGLRRGRRSENLLEPGDALDFWRVLIANRRHKHLLLFAEMKLPGEAWLEFKIKKRDEKQIFVIRATFHPKGLLGRLYWYILIPIHFFIFREMAKAIINYRPKQKPVPDKP